jgi:hypothetical protein
MNDQPIESARDADLRASLQALRRAARRAYELAAQTGTAIILSRNGQIERIEPKAQDTLSDVQQQRAPYADRT